MHRRHSAVTLGLLSALCASLANAQSNAAQPSSTNEDGSTQLETVVVESGPFGGRGDDELTRPVDVIYGDALARKNKATIGDLLSEEPGVANSGFGPGVGHPVIRGQSGPRVSILQNGIGSMDASSVSADHAVALDPGGAEQVEIIKGPATLIYGSGAIGGIINVVDDRLPDEISRGLSGAGDFAFADNADERNGSLKLGYGTDAVQFNASYGYRRADDFEIPGYADADGEGERGVLENSDVDTQSGSASVSWITPMHVLGFAVSRFDTLYGVPGHEHGDEEGDEGVAEEEGNGTHIDLDQTRYDLRGDWIEPFAGLEKIKLRAGYNDYEHAEIEGSGEVGTLFKNKAYEARVELLHAAVAGWHGEVGSQLSHRDFKAIGEEALVPPTIARNLGLFVVEEHPFGDGHRLELGARVERASAEANGTQPNTDATLPDLDFTPLSLSAGSVFALGHDYHLHFNLARSQRAPTTEELYSFGAHEGTKAYERGDVDLDVETSNNVELSLERHHGRFRSSASVYYNRIDDYIYEKPVDLGLNVDGSGTASSDGIADRVDDEGNFDPDGELVLYDYEQSRATFYGLEAQAEYALLQQGPFKLDGRIFFDTVRGELDGGRELPRITPSRLGGGLDASFRQWSASLALTHVDEQDRVAALETETGGYTLLSADLGYRLHYGTGMATFYLRGRNLLDEEAREHTSFLKDLAPLTGRTLMAGVRFEFTGVQGL